MNARMRLLSAGTFVCVLSAGMAALAQPAPAAPPAPPPGPPAAAPAPAAPPPAAAPAPAAPPGAAQPPAGAAPAAAADAAEPQPAPPPPAGKLELAPPAPLPPPLLEPPPVALPSDAPPPPPPAEKLKAGKEGFLQLGLLMQGWFVYDHARDLTTDKGGNVQDSTATFRLRRTQFRLKGSILPDAVDYYVLLDPMKVLKFKKGDTVTGADDASVTEYKPPGDNAAAVDGGALLDFAITFKTCVADISIGQWKIPIAREGSQSSSELLMPERSIVTRFYGDSYDMGLRLEKKFKFAETQSILYSVQLLNGAGLSQTDNNRQKDVALRLEYSPLEGLMVGGAGLMSVGQRDQSTTHDFVEADARLEKAGLLVDGSVIWGRTHGGSEVGEWQKSRGAFVGLGYTIAKKLQPVARIGVIDVDENVDEANMPLNARLGFKDDQARAYEVGLNYFISGKNVKLQASYSYFDFDNQLKKMPHRQQAIASAQVYF